jgi:prepilin-type N-terminal cleavage/methylation domain-containing protein
MSTEKYMKIYLLKILQQRQTDTSGFTMIELLITILMISILASISIPSILNQANKAREAEGISNVGALNSAQQLYYVEKGIFANSLEELGTGIKPITENYEYRITSVDQANKALQEAYPVNVNLRPTTGIAFTFAVPDGSINMGTTICRGQAKTPLVIEGIACPVP